MPTTDVITFGCRLNLHESEAIRTHAEAAGHEHAIIINSCAVTAEAERQARQAIRKARREHPDAHIIVTGCAAQTNAEAFSAMPEVNQVLGNHEKMLPESYRAPEKILVNDIMSIRETAAHLHSPHADTAHTRAFVQVQNGCNHRCTFCIIPYGRGNSRSVPADAVVQHIRDLTHAGYKEAVLTGVDISDYGRDLPTTPSLGSLVRRILREVPELPRLRLSSIDAVEVDAELLLAFAEEPRLMPYLHISLQAGDDMILKRMKRRHLRQDIVTFCDTMRRIRPDIAFGADIIAGFPTETDAMFANTLALVDDVALTWLHVFPYSARTGTPAARMPQVPKPLRKERAAQLRDAGQRQVQRFLQSRHGKPAQILVERDNLGHTEHFAPVKLQAPAGTLLHQPLHHAGDWLVST